MKESFMTRTVTWIKPQVTIQLLDGTFPFTSSQNTSLVVGEAPGIPRARGTLSRPSAQRCSCLASLPSEIVKRKASISTVKHQIVSLDWSTDQRTLPVSEANKLLIVSKMQRNYLDRL
jgi:hypothetical protein